METLIQKDANNPIFTETLFTVAKIRKQFKCPSIDEWIKKLWNIYTGEYYSAIKKNENLPFATAWMDLESIILGETSQTEKDKYYIIDMWNLK